VLEGGLVEDENVAEGCECAINKGAEEPKEMSQYCEMVFVYTEP